MTEKNYKVGWSDEAKSDMKDIYNYIKNKSPHGAKSVISDILNAPKKIHFPNKMNLSIIIMLITGLSFEIINCFIEYMKKRELVVYVVFDARQSPEKLIDK